MALDRSQSRRVDPLTNGVKVRSAHSRDELEEAYRLVYASYVQRGYVREEPSGLRLSVFNAFPDTRTFVALVHDTVVATVSIVPDTPVGLPMDSIYHEEVQQFRDQGRKLAEVIMLADRRRELRRTLPMVKVLMKRVFDYATLVLDVNDLCITVNPRHEHYYERYLLFKPLGGLKEYPSVEGNPALAKRLDLDTVRQECQGNDELIRLFFTNRTPRHLLENAYRLSTEDLRYFFVELTPVLSEAPREAVEYLREQYPDAPWDKWTSFA